MDNPAFPQTLQYDAAGRVAQESMSGMTVREHAALTLRVPDSGDEQLDDMVRKANRRDAAVSAMQGLCANQELTDNDKNGKWVAEAAVHYADAMLARLEESK